MIIKALSLFLVILFLCIISFINPLKTNNIFLIFTLIVYLFVVFEFTLLGREGSNSELILLPFNSYCRLLSVRWFGWGEYIFLADVGNVLLFVPCGMMVSNWLPYRHKYILSGLLGLIFSVAIELTQFKLMIGSFETDDIINNTWGSIIGCCCATVLINKDKNLRNNLIVLLPLVCYLILLIVFCSFPIAKEWIVYRN